MKVPIFPIFKCGFLHVLGMLQRRSIAHMKAQDFFFPQVLSSSELQVSKVHLHFNENMSICWFVDYCGCKNKHMAKYRQGCGGGKSTVLINRTFQSLRSNNI